MKKMFTITVEYPDNDVIPSCEVIEVAQECIEHYMELHFGANIMDGDYDRIKVKEISDKTMIDKACEWLKQQVYQEYGGGPLERLVPDERIEAFRKAMEE